MAQCVVCRAPAAAHFDSIDGKNYWRCGTCQATFLEPDQQPGPDEERAHYLLHENDPADPRYRSFLGKLAEPLLGKLPPGQRGLDYGCGPGPALAVMLREVGHTADLYDPYFCPDRAPLSKTYDFITCTEAAEHFHRPADEFERLDGMLRPGGWLAVMTCFQTDDSRFANWHYRSDPTHVVFYRVTTFQKIAAQRNWTFESPIKNVVLMQKS